MIEAVSSSETVADYTKLRHRRQPFSHSSPCECTWPENALHMPVCDKTKNMTLLSLIRTRQCPKLFRVRKTRIFCRRRHSILTRPQLNRQGAILICLIAYSFIYWYIPSFILYISETLLSLYYVWENIPTDSYRTLLITGWYPCFLFRMSRFRISTRSFPQSLRYKFRDNTLHIAFFHILYNSLTINRPIIRRESR